MLLAPITQAKTFKDNGNGTITVTYAGLGAPTVRIWQKQDDGAKRSWKDALAYCRSLSLAGHADWRVPDKHELQAIARQGKKDPIYTTVFPGTQRAGYWTSMSTDVAAWAFYVHFGEGRGQVNYGPKTMKQYVRCVRRQ